MFEAYYPYHYHRWNGATWLATTYVNGMETAVQAYRPVVDPHTPGRVYGVGTSSCFWTSLDYGVHWTGDIGNLAAIQFRQADNIKWHAFTAEYSMSHGDMFFDKNVPGRAWLYEGIGVWYANDMPDNQSPSTPVTWHEFSVGIENMTSNTLTISPRGDLGYACWDRVGFVIPRGEIGRVFPRAHAANSPDLISISYAQGIDCAGDDPDFWAVAGQVQYGAGRSEFGGYTRDCGRSWAAYEGNVYEQLGSAGGGNIVALTTNVFVQLQLFNGGLIFTTDRGAKWQSLTPFFGPHFSSGYSFSGKSLCRKILIQDRYHANTAAFYCIGGVDETENAASVGFWKIRYNDDGTFTCTRKSTTLINGFFAAFNAKLVQYGDGHWLFTAGEGGGDVWESTDDGAKWTAVRGSDNINGNFGGTAGWFISPYTIGVGAPAFPDEPKTVVVIGHRMPTYDLPANHDYLGTWLCRNFTDRDADRVWERIAQFAGGSLGGYRGSQSDIAACPIDFGRFYIANGAGGVFEMRHVDRRRASA
jgi:hypothetical protein